MLFEEGVNYFFFKGSPDSVIRIDSSIQSFYDFPIKKIPKLPSLFSDPSLAPRFLYDIRWNRRNYPSKEINIPDYISKSNQSNPKPEIFTKKSYQYQIGGLISGKHFLERTTRNQMISTRYLSLRDIVNPNYNENEVLEEIDKLYFKKGDKNTLSKLVKILYAGKPSEERDIIANLFAHEPTFANFLRNQIFHIEILPLIHGIFLQEILAKMDERFIKHSLPTLSAPVRRVIEKSVSKNKFSSILNSPSMEPPQGESLVEKIEALIFSRFSRSIYYEEGNYISYRIPKQGNDDYIQSFVGTNTNRFNFVTTITQPSNQAEQTSIRDSETFIEFFSQSGNHLFFRILDWIDIIRFDTIIHLREFESIEYYRLPPGLIITIPYYATSKYTIGCGITKSRKSFEFLLLGFAY
ncbi:flagellar motor switch protein FliG [Leptospira sp. GIMC2001]|uniref:flagellar motor switch protein FliG n=1 Tax=Leptospira sp. GIMC2001 TaxID=1513297 RepID=UPI00234BA120|nr:flagellar motor switch protein FliG [Leptospira sp. GIMC2001]WCL48171.1 flagellar motor switch protein FliG [Leptospira sp. GIMC2001]